MPITVTMPALSPTMTEGTLAKWHVKPGDAVSSGDILAEIETDKATMEVEAVDEGTVGRLLVEEGTEGVAVNAPIAFLLEEGEDAASLPESAPPSPAEAPQAKPQDRGGDGKAEVTPPAPQAPAQSAAAQARTGGNGKAPPAPQDAEGRRIAASPLARRMAAQAGLDLGALNGSGPHGRIVKADIEAALAKGAPERAPDARTERAEAPAAQPFEPEFELEPLTSFRRTVARRMVESKQAAPHFYLTIDCQMDRMLELRGELNQRAEGRAKLSVNDLIIKAAAAALMRVPAANVAWSEAGVKRYKTADISVAVATDRGLITPVIRRAEQKGLAAISKEMRELGLKAREGKLKPEDYQGGSFSLSNLGMYGIKQFEAVINTPQACILAVGASEARPVVREGALAVATMMSCTLSVDHRAVDGALGATYLAAFKEIVEDPLSLLL